MTTDTFFNGRVRVNQERSGYRFSIDAVLLAYYARPRPGDKIIDLGTGCGIIPVILAHRHHGITLYGIEVQKALAEIATLNAKENRMSDRITIIEKDLKLLEPQMVSGPVNLVVSNPPYRRARSGRINPDPQQAIARHEITATLLDVVQAAYRVLRNSGRLVMIFPAERITDIIFQMRSSLIEPKHLQIVYSEIDMGAMLVLIEGRKGGGPGMKVAPPLTIYRQDGSYTDAVLKMFAP
ncbi:MAG: tRNA1(Val) (adenine(37)-N6)-methyltransferase [Desulfobacterales bacterium]|nr:tRNA1(Val) (adenine(37)-N6)-methyltransferase [Desulfobacterales bacterium]MDP6809062.1 tRNA1(Val) (adenine(37)-N6)-methyltransferase [Desulfobacterales bacterium]